MKKIEDNNTLVRTLSDPARTVNLQLFSDSVWGCLTAAVPHYMAHNGQAKGGAVYRILSQHTADPHHTALLGLPGNCTS